MVQYGSFPGAAGVYRWQRSADGVARSVAAAVGSGVVQGAEAAHLVDAAIALRGVQRHEHAEFPEPRQYAWELELRLADDDGPGDSAADAIRGEAAVLEKESNRNDDITRVHHG